MKVAVNAMFLDPGRSSGTETYLRGLVPELARRVEVTLLTTRRGARAVAEEGWDLEVVALAADEGERLRRLWAEQVWVPRAARSRGAAILHSLANTGPLWTPMPHVMTVHDVNWVHERTLPRSTVLALKLTVGPAARRAVAISCATEAAAEDVRRTLAVTNVVVIPHGAGRVTAVEPRPPSFKVTEPFVLNVGVIRWHKNQELLVRALEQLDGMGLVLAGAHEDYASEVAAVVERLGLADRVAMPGYVDDAELEWLWRHAAVAAFPTRAEGFGLPLAEAMQRGVAIAASDIAVLREVGGDIPEYFDPDDSADAARAISRATPRPPPPPFTWADAAERTVELYERCVSGA